MRTPVRKWETRVVSKRSTFELDEKSATAKDESLEDSADLTRCQRSEVTHQNRRRPPSRAFLANAFGVAQFAEITSDLKR